VFVREYKMSKEKKKLWMRWYMIVLYCFVGLMIISAFLPDDSSDKTIYVCPDGSQVYDSSQCPTSTQTQDNIGDDVKNTESQISQTSTNNYQDCIKNVFKEECKKYDLLYTDYSSYVGFITCTDDGSYTMDDIGDNSKYLQIYAPTRSLEIKCGTYKEPTDSKLKCEEDLFESKCQQVGLIYTDWSPFVGFITCTDDGIYILDEIGSNNKYQQVYITSEFIDSQCS